MKVWNGTDRVPADQRSVVTIGNFDGVHQGHSRVIGACVDRARKTGLEAVAITFDPHPRQVHRPDVVTWLVTPLHDRLEFMAAAGLDATLVVPYNRDLYLLSPEEFAVQYLVERLGAREVIVGEDFRFGRANAGDIDTLRELGRTWGFDVAMVADIVSPSGRRWSSSWVRELLAAGDVHEASGVLGRFHRVSGPVVHGQKRGRQLGFPTANVDTGAQLIPADGVYAGWLVREALPQTRTPVGGGQEFLPAAISIGTNPQFSGDVRTVEAHVLGRSDLDLYGEDVTVVFVRRLRPMRSFGSVDELLTQMDDDILKTAQTLGVRPSTRVEPAEVTAGQHYSKNTP